MSSDASEHGDHKSSDWYEEMEDVSEAFLDAQGLSEIVGLFMLDIVSCNLCQWMYCRSLTNTGSLNLGF